MHKLYCYGDSNTFGWDPREALGGRYERAWPDMLHTLCGMECLNKGVPGRRIPTERKELSRLLTSISDSGAHGLLIMLGTNDLLLLPRHSAAETAEKMEALLAFVCRELPDMPIMLLGLPPLVLEGEASLAWVEEVNGHYAALAAKYALPYYDPTPLSLPLAYDGVHLTEEGHALLAEGVAAAMKERNVPFSSRLSSRL